MSVDEFPKTALTDHEYCEGFLLRITPNMSGATMRSCKAIWIHLVAGEMWKAKPGERNEGRVGSRRKDRKIVESRG